MRSEIENKKTKHEQQRNQKIDIIGKKQKKRERKDAHTSPLSHGSQDREKRERKEEDQSTRVSKKFFESQKTREPESPSQ